VQGASNEIQDANARHLLLTVAIVVVEQAAEHGEKALGKIFPALLQYRLREDISEDEDESINDEDGWVAESALI